MKWRPLEADALPQVQNGRGCALTGPCSVQMRLSQLWSNRADPASPSRLAANSPLSCWRSSPHAWGWNPRSRKLTPPACGLAKRVPTLEAKFPKSGHCSSVQALVGFSTSIARCMTTHSYKDSTSVWLPAEVLVPTFVMDSTYELIPYTPVALVIHRGHAGAGHFQAGLRVGPELKQMMDAWLDPMEAFQMQVHQIWFSSGWFAVIVMDTPHWCLLLCASLCWSVTFEIRWETGPTSWFRPMLPSLRSRLLRLSQSKKGDKVWQGAVQSHLITEDLMVPYLQESTESELGTLLNSGQVHPRPPSNGGATDRPQQAGGLGAETTRPTEHQQRDLQSHTLAAASESTTWILHEAALTM